MSLSAEVGHWSPKFAIYSRVVFVVVTGKVKSVVRMSRYGREGEPETKGHVDETRGS